MIHINFDPLELRPDRRKIVIDLLALDLAERKAAVASGTLTLGISKAEITVLDAQLAEYRKAIA